MWKCRSHTLDPLTDLITRKGISDYKSKKDKLRKIVLSKECQEAYFLHDSVRYLFTFPYLIMEWCVTKIKLGVHESWFEIIVSFIL